MIVATLNLLIATADGVKLAVNDSGESRKWAQPLSIKIVGFAFGTKETIFVFKVSIFVL